MTSSDNSLDQVSQPKCQKESGGIYHSTICKDNPWNLAPANMRLQKWKSLLKEGVAFFCLKGSIFGLNFKAQNCQKSFDLST